MIKSRLLPSPDSQLIEIISNDIYIYTQHVYMIKRLNVYTMTMYIIGKKR